MNQFCAGKYSLPFGEKAYVMGILNVTPDSLTDRSRFLTPEKAAARALEMQDQGADIIDIGAQSARAGSTLLTPEEELERLLPVLMQLNGRLAVPLSVDTFYPRVAAEVLKYGVSVLNDLNGFDNAEMVAVAARSDCGCIVMHHNGTEEKIIQDVNQYFIKKRDILIKAGIRKERLCFDPGIGFGKTHEQDLCLLGNVAQLRVDGCALLVAASRKQVIGLECGSPPYEQRLAGTLAAHSIAVADGADMVRAHDVAQAVQAAKIAFAVRRARG
ncbi:dihydropteroate synthase [Caproiciproducens faecalis]|uniref:Dihydropteroate synthase n=1 Tax=Caproiciproducens faecalis TaxID=2820301 RepID=A0ABS7DPI9_9FIRM|nr:dihydropteroate synthase [Caproiciproducens faecalis]MBW7573223.1 dihydropteroate synthase [Caproiciproducens faecalis]